MLSTPARRLLLLLAITALQACGGGSDDQGAKPDCQLSAPPPATPSSGMAQIPAPPSRCASV